MTRKSKYSPEFKAEIVEYYKTHTAKETAEKFAIPKHNVEYFGRTLGYQKGNSKHPTDFKHEVCQYYDNHTHLETIAKFGISLQSLYTWRRELGYRNKSRGYNLYTEGLQPAMKKRERRDFMMTRAENGDLKAELLEVKLQHAVLQREFVKLKETILEALQ